MPNEMEKIKRLCNTVKWYILKIQELITLISYVVCENFKFEEFNKIKYCG